MKRRVLGEYPSKSVRIVGKCKLTPCFCSSDTSTQMHGSGDSVILYVSYCTKGTNIKPSGVCCGRNSIPAKCTTKKGSPVLVVQHITMEQQIGTEITAFTQTRAGNSSSKNPSKVSILVLPSSVRRVVTSR